MADNTSFRSVTLIIQRKCICLVLFGLDMQGKIKKLD